MNVIDILTPADRARVIKKLGCEWTDRLLSLEGGPLPLLSYVSEAVLIAQVRPFTQPLLTDQNILDLMAGLEGALKAQDDYVLFGEWDPEHDEALAGRSHEDRLDLLSRDVDVCVFRLMWGTEPCVTCMFTAEVDEWQPVVRALGSENRCRTHGREDVEGFRSFQEQRRLTVVK